MLKYGFGLLGASYVSVSVFLWHNPHYLHSSGGRKPFPHRCRHISHRGGAGDNLENTMTAFRNAAQHQTEMFEIDVQLTKDKQVVISHDNNLQRVAGVDINISDTPYKKIPLLSQHLQVTFSHHNKAACQNNDRRIPLLSELLEEFPDMPLNIDPKTNNSELHKLLVDLVTEFKRTDSVCIGTRNSTVTNNVRKLNPNIPTLFSERECIQLALLFYTGLLPFFSLKAQCLELPYPEAVLRKENLSMLDRCLLRATGWLLMRPALFKHLQKRGVKVYLWVVNEEQDFHVCLNKLKVDGVMTDYPEKLKNYLNSNNIKD